MMKGTETRIMHYTSRQKILLVGEGDFSFASCLASAFGSATNIVATSFLDQGIEHWSSVAHLEYLERKGCLLLYGIDVHDMNNHRTLKHFKFDVVVFNFPHSGHFDWLCESDTELIQMHKELVEAYFRSASKMLNEGGEVHLTHRDDSPYNTWEVEKLAAKSGLRLIEKAPFYKGDYPGYHNKRGGYIHSNKTFPIKCAFTFKFVLKVPKEDVSGKQVLRENSGLGAIEIAVDNLHI